MDQPDENVKFRVEWLQRSDGRWVFRWVSDWRLEDEKEDLGKC